MPNALLLLVQKDCKAQFTPLWTQRLQAAHGGIVSTDGTNQTFGDSCKQLLLQVSRLNKDLTEP